MTGSSSRAPAALRDPVLRALAGLAVLSVVWFLLGPGGVPVFWLVQVALDVGTSWLSYRVSVIATDRAIRRFWRGMAAAPVLFSAADILQVVRVLLNPQATTGVIQPVLVAAGVGVFLFVALTHPLRVAGREQLRLWLDAAAALTGVAVVIWYFVVGDELSRGGASGLGASAVAGAVMFVSAFGVVKLMLSGAAPFSRPAGIAGLVSTTGLALASVAQSAVHDNRVAWLAQLIPCIVYMAVPRIQELEMRGWCDATAPRRRQGYSRLPYVAVLATQTLLIAGLWRGGLDARTWGVTIGAVVITALVVTRQLVAFHDNARLVVSLDASVREARTLEEQLRHKATHDPLTLLANRALFDERMQQAGSGDVGVLLIDLDDFKEINDTLGHHVGDAVLVAVAERLRQCVRQGDTVARLGGDEFAVLLPDSPPGQASSVAARITAVLAEPVLVEEHLLALRASIGVAAGGFGQADSLLREADAAMYLVKHNGKGGYHQVA
jgi:diguanylate cyclase (GGDEF)-like protein